MLCIVRLRFLVNQYLWNIQGAKGTASSDCFARSQKKTLVVLTLCHSAASERPTVPMVPAKAII